MDKQSLQLTKQVLGSYAAILSMVHGVFELLQEPGRPDGFLIQALGPPCQPDQIWHACFPALTLLPGLKLSGMIAIGTGLSLLTWSLFSCMSRKTSLIQIFLAALLLIVGGGFVPVWIGVMSGLAGLLYPKTSLTSGRPRGGLAGFVAELWPWLLGLLVFWLPGSWILGLYLGGVMLRLGTALFLVFDLGLPVLIVVSAYVRENHLRWGVHR